MLNKVIVLGLFLGLSSCMYKPTNEFCSGLYTLHKSSFDSLFQVHEFLFKDSLCNYYRVNYTAKGLLQQICDSVIRTDDYHGNGDELFEDKKGYLENFMDNGNMELIAFYPDSISIRFKNYNNPNNHPSIVIFNKPQKRKTNNEVKWLDSFAYLIPMKE